MSVIGQEAGIEHGSLKGYRQHKYRKVPATKECGCLAAVREDNRRYAAKPAKPTAKAWNGGMTGTPPTSEPRPLTGECPKDGCGEPATIPRPAPQMVRVEVPGSREPARWYCPGWCVRYGHALAEIRAIDV